MGRAQETALDGSLETGRRSLRERRRGRLLRHYFLISFVLLAGGLVVSGLGEIYFRYQEIREHIGVLQRDAAETAAFRLGDFIQDISRSVMAATKRRAVTANELSTKYK